jgi:CubicO group peptidase (beta-lactamase class C family)
MAVGTGGTRRIGTVIAVTHNDRFHIGSDTKAMTSLLAAMMVEAGKLRWDSTLEPRCSQSWPPAWTPA